MFRRHNSASAWQKLALAAALLLCSGSLRSASGQLFPGEKSGVTRSNRAPNPQTAILSNKRSNKQQAIEQAIELGNKNRDALDYDKALTSYQQAEKLNPQEARAHYGLGNLYSDLYCNDSAIEAYRKAIELKKDYLEAHIGLGYVYAEEKRFDHAEEEFKKALALSARNVEANIGLGRVYSKKEKYKEAIAQIKLVINAQSIKDQAQAYVALGDVYYDEQESNQDVIAQYEKAISLKPDLAKAYIQLAAVQLASAFSGFSYDSVKEAKAQEKVQTLARRATDNIKRAIEFNYNQPDVYAVLGLGLAFQFHFKEAVSQINLYFDKINLLEKRLASTGLKCDSGFNLLKATGNAVWGMTYILEALVEVDKKRETELLSDAAKQLYQAIELKQDLTVAYLVMGSIYQKQGKNEEAIEHYKKFIRFETNSSLKASAYERIGMIYHDMGRVAVGIDHLQEAIKLNPKGPSPYESLASIYVNQGKYEETIDLLKKAIELKPEVDANSYFYLAVAYYIRFLKKRSEEDSGEAIRLLKKAIEIKSDHAEAYYTLGATYLSQSKADEALTNLKKAAEYKQDALTYLSMARVYSELKNNDDAAIGSLKKAIEIKPDYADAYWYLGQIYYRKNDNAEALKQMLKTIEIDPKYLQAYLDAGYIYATQKNYPEAIKHLKKATEIEPTNPEAYRGLAEVYETQQTNQDAAYYYEAAANRLNADDSFNKNLYMGMANRLRGRYAEALGYFQKLINLEPRDKAHYEMGLTYVASKNKSAALEQHQQLTQLKSSLAEELLKKIEQMK